MNNVGRILCAIVLLCCIGAAFASTDSTEITDMWWNPDESGWGVNVILQKNVAFLTFFVYDAARNPVWYTAAAYRTDQATFVWTGSLYATNGPWFGGPFPPANVQARQAGTTTFTVANDNLDQGTLTYTIDGVTVTKAVQRQTWADENFTGTYAGGFSVRSSNCNPSSLNGVHEQVGQMSVSQNGTSFAATISAGISCSYVGTYDQVGKLGHVIGNYTCSDGTHGTFAAGDLTPTVNGFNGHIVGQDQFCQWSGKVGGIYHAQ